MFMKQKKRTKQWAAIALSILTVLSTVTGSASVAMAADGTINLTTGESISYGSYSTTKMAFDGGNTAYCVEPMRKTPSAGSYNYDLLGSSSSVRKALYYLPGGYGYDANVKSHLSGWSTNDQYVIGHLVAAYLNLGGNESEAYYGASERYINKANEIVSVIQGLPAAPASFRAFRVLGNGVQTIAGSWYQAPNGWIALQKATANEEISDGNSNYSLEGAKYGIYKGSTLVTTLTTDAKGYAKSGELEQGSYTIKEIEASKGYALDTESYNVTVVSEETAKLEVLEIPQNNPIKLLLSKVDGETNENLAQGAASLENAEFTVKFYTKQMNEDPAVKGEEPARTWVFKTDIEGKIDFTKSNLVYGDEFYYGADQKTICLPLGTVTIQETKAPTGYLIDETVYVQKIISEGNNEVVNVYKEPTVAEQIVRGDLEFVKVSDGDLNRLANVPFKITSITTGESHVIVTDKNGYASTASKWNKHTKNTNEGKTPEDGVWFGSGKVDDSKGALPYDQYEIEELRCDTNSGMSLLKFNVSVYKNDVTIQLGTLTNDRIEIGTKVRDEESGTQLSKPDENVILVDTVSYEGLKKGQEYKVVGTLMNKETGEPLEIDGEIIKAETIFVAKKANGSVDVIFEFDGSYLKGKTIVVFETLYQGELEVAVHADIEDEDQTIYFPEIGTVAKDQESETNEGVARKEVTIVDTVAYSNLIPKKEYKVIGVLMDKETGEPLEIDEKSVVSEAIFVAEETTGTVEVTFTFDGSELAGRSVVVFEKLFVIEAGKEGEIAFHEDIEDEGQTVTFIEGPKEEVPEEPEEPTETPKDVPKEVVGENPKTGDDSKVTIWMILTTLGLGTIGGYGVYCKQKRKKSKIED